MKIGRKDSIAGIDGFIIPSPYFDIAIGRDGELWVVNSGMHQLESYDKEGNQISSWKKTSMRLDGFSGCCNPSHIAILPNGSFVTSEKGIERVKIHEPSGKFKSVVAAPQQFEKGTRGLDLAIDSENRIIILDPKKVGLEYLIKNKVANLLTMITRKDFIIKIFRTATFASLAGLSGYLLLREQTDEVCNFDFVCKNCKKLKACNLPEAVDHKNSR